MKQLFIVLFMFGVLCTFFVVNASAASVSGTMTDTSSSDNGVVNWVLEYDTNTEEAKLTLSGDGYMPNDPGSDDIPEIEYWYTTLYDSGCWITELVIEEGVRSISESAFVGEERLESVVLPESIEFIGDYAFWGTAIASVNIPSKVENVNGTMFSADYIENYYVDENNIYLKSVDGVVYSRDMSVLKVFPVGRYTDNRNYSFDIPETVKTIDTNAFMNGDAEEITIPGTVKYISNQAFVGNIYLERLNIEEGVERIFDSAFLSCTSLKNVSIPSSVTYLGYWSLGYVAAIDCEGISYFLDCAGVTHPEITEKNASFYVGFTQYTLSDFTYWKPAEDFSVTGSCGSAAENYAFENGFIFTRNHISSEWITEVNPTCTQIGSKYKSCTVCEGIIERSEIPETGHTSSDYIIDKEPTCADTGSKYKECTVCETILETVEIPATGHTQSDYIIDKEPTCTNSGSKHKECTVCEEVLATVKISAIGHKASSWITDKKATVNATGSKHKECTECGKTLETAKIAQLKPGRTTVKATTTSTGIKITWSKVTGADKYTVYRKIGDGSYKAIKTVTGTSFTDTTAKSGTKYRYNVKAKNEAGYGEYAKSGVTKLFLSTPKVTVANASTGVTVKWNKITGAKGYYVYRKASGAKSWTKIATVKSGSTVSYTDEKASAGKKYYYTVKAYNGDYVSTTKASSIIERLKAPTIKSVTSGKSGVTVKWAKATGADGYYVYRKTGSGSYTKIATVKGNTKVSYLDKTAKKGKTYTYYVKAYSGKSVSTSSKTLKIKDKY